MNELRTVKLKRLFIFLLPIITAIISLSVIFFTADRLYNTNLSASAQQTYTASAQANSLPTLDMNAPAIKHYYNELNKKKTLEGSNSPKELSCAFYQRFEANISNIMSGTPFNLFSGISGTVSKFFSNSTVMQNELQNAIDAFSMDYPAISSAFSWELPNSYDQNTFMISTKAPTASITFEKLIKGINDMTTIAESFNFSSSTSDYEKVLVVHDFIINTTRYVSGANLNQTAYSALINGETVCAGYAKSFKYIMDTLDINCILVSGVGGNPANPENHIWNYVQLNTTWYCIDLTWDDSGEVLNYDYFLIDYSSFTNDGTNIHTAHNNFHYTGGGTSEMTYTFPTPSNMAFAYPENPNSTSTYSTHVETSIDDMTLGVDYEVETISPAKRGSYVIVKLTLLDKDAFYLVEPNSIISSGSTPILIDSTQSNSPQPTWIYKVIITNSNCNIIFNFDTYFHSITLTPIAVSDGTVTINKTEAEKGETITIAINLLNPLTRSVRDIIIKDEANKTVSYFTKVRNQEYTFTMPSSDTTIQVVIATVYSITQGTIDNGEATLHFSQITAMEGETILVEAKNITEGMRATALSSTSVSEFISLGRKTNQFKFVMPASNVVVNATLTPIPPTVETNDFKINMVEGSASISYSVESLEVGEEVTITIKPEFGKKLKSISCSGVEFNTVKEGVSYSFVVPSENFEVELEFEDKYGFDAMLAVYIICGFVGFMFIIFLFTAFPKKDKSGNY